LLVVDEDGKKSHARVTAPKPDSKPRMVVPRTTSRERVLLRKGGSDSTVNGGMYDSRMSERRTGMHEAKMARGTERKTAGADERTRRAMDCGMRMVWMASRAYSENWKWAARCGAESVSVAWHRSSTNSSEASVNVHENTIRASICRPPFFGAVLVGNVASDEELKMAVGSTRRHAAKSSGRTTRNIDII